MQRFALWVEFEIKPGAMPAFLAAAPRDDEAAFEAHRALPHFKAFGAATENLVAAKSITRLRADEAHTAAPAAASLA